MIFGRIEDREHIEFLPPSVLQCFDCCQSGKLGELEKGSHEISGENIFVNIVEYETGARAEKAWEAHRAYLDIHVMLKGEEIIDVNFIGRMKQGIFEPDSDYLPLEGKASAAVHCRPMDFLICFPEDGHKPGIQTETPQMIRKAIFKVRL